MSMLTFPVVKPRATTTRRHDVSSNSKPFIFTNRLVFTLAFEVCIFIELR